jgi:lysine 2,3-aminomutase
MEYLENKDWYDWRWQLRKSQRSASGKDEVEKVFPSLITPYYASLIDESDISNDPVYKQALPDIREINDLDSEDNDPLDEERQMPVPLLIHRYRDRVVLISNNRCAVHCRFCLRKRNWKGGQKVFEISDKELKDVCSYIEEHDEVNEVLVSGGDPLMLETERLKEILLRISQIPSITTLRLGTRIPVVLPMRIDDELVEMLTQIPGLWVATHFNHPVELTDESIQACSKLIKSGVPVINQTVLLKNINDDDKTLTSLFRKLAANRIKPHYLFHVDPVAGNAHFATGLDKGIELIRGFRNTLSSLETPIFAFDLPGGGGKVPLMPDYCRDGGFETLTGGTQKFTAR